MMKLTLRALALSVAVIALAPSPATQAKEPLVVNPASVGFNRDRLERIGEWLRSEIQQKKIPGATVLVGRKGKVAYYASYGAQTPSAPDPMPRDAIFRLYSMTKPVTTVAAMMLVEEGKLTLETPLAALIPAFKDVKVAVEQADPAGGAPKVDLVPARRPITVHDLLRHTSGLTYGFFGESAAKRAYRDAKIDAGEISNAEFAERVAAMPLGSQPGSTWDYSYSTDILGRVVEIASGQSLGAFFKMRIFDPLGMTDTSFYVTDPAKQKRLAEPFPDDRSIGVGIDMSNPRVAQKAEPGGQGLVGTAADYSRFLQMLLNGGQLDGKRYLSPETMAFMTSDHLGAIGRGNLYLPGPGYAFGLGFGVRSAAGEAPYAGSAGDYYWGGAGGTYFWVDPKTDMYVVFMMQSVKQRTPYRSILRNMIYAAIEK